MVQTLFDNELFDQFPIPSILLDKDFNIKVVNNKFTNSFGYTLIDLNGVDTWVSKICFGNINIKEKLLLFWNKGIKNAFATKKTIQNRYYTIKCKDNTIKHIRISFSYYKVYLLLSLIDISTEVYKLRDHFFQLELFKQIIDFLPGTFFLLNSDLSINFWNKSYQQTMGFSNEEIKHRFNSKFEGVKNQKLYQKTLNKLKSKGFATLEIDFEDKNGKIQTIFYQGIKLKIGNKIKYAIYGFDVGDLAKAKKMIIEKQNFYEKLINTSPFLIYIAKVKNGEVKYINESGLKNYGYSLEEFFQEIKGLDAEVFLPEEKERLRKNLLKINNLKDDEVNIIEYKADIPHLGLREFKSYSKVFKRDESGNVLEYSGFAYDVTDEKKVYNDLLLSEERFRNIFNSTKDCIIIFDTHLKPIVANKSALELLELKEDEFVDVNPLSFFVGENSPKLIKERIDSLDNESYITSEYDLKTRSNKKIIIETRTRQITYNNKPAVITSFNDITQRKRLEKEMYLSAINAEESERERVAKELHDGLGPLLSTCRIYLHNLKSSKKPEVHIKSISNLEELISEALVGIKEMSNNLSPHVLRNFGLIQATKSFVDRLENTCNIIVESEYNDEQRFSELVEISVYRVITELINNSLKYSEAKKISIHFKEMNKFFCITFQDNGIGFDYNKEIKENKGFGLTNIQSRINNIGGIIDYISSPGNGVNVCIQIAKEKCYLND